MIEEAIGTLSQAKDLDSRTMSRVMEEIMGGKADTPQIVSFLEKLSQKGETAEELSAAVSVMRKFSVKVTALQPPVLDTCGTGGDAAGTFNISTIAAFVAAGCGITVAKHGNRSVSSLCGSADVLEALGVKIDLPLEKIEQCLNEAGIAFLFAPNLHPAMKYAFAARKQIGKRTIFNLLGPLSNPAQASHQLVGVFDNRWTVIVASALLELGSKHALVAHGQDGLDEITTTDVTFVTEVYQQKLKSYELNPEDYSIKKSSSADLLGADPVTNAGLAMEILKGSPGPKRDIVVLNAGAAIYVADNAASLKEGVELAKNSIDSGKALEKLEFLKKISQGK